MKFVHLYTKLYKSVIFWSKTLAILLFICYNKCVCNAFYLYITHYRFKTEKSMLFLGGTNNA